MVERQDIDALLIGSLYGELSSTEEARLQAHLESHPADRAALEDLAQARSAVRESRILQVQLEPPQSISALLLQEAARRVPRKAEEAKESWLFRFFRSFATHPAMAAAAMLVLVIGVAGTIYVRKGDHYAEQTARSNAAPAALAEPAAEPAAAAPATPPAARDQGQAFRVDLDEAESTGRGDRNQPGNSEGGDGEFGYGTIGAGGAGEDRAVARGDSRATSGAAVEAPAKRKADASKPSVRALEVTTPARPGPQELEDAVAERKAAPQAEKARAKAENAFVAPADASGAPRSVQQAPQAPRATVAKDTAPESKPPPPPTGPSGAAYDKVTSSVALNSADEAQTELAWARDQHARVVAQVRAGNCRAAADLALAVSNRAPGYFQQNVEGDRSVKECLPLINTEREKYAEQQAQRVRANRRGDEEQAAPSKASSTKSGKAAKTTKKQ
ncbi:MAG: hypothetical protein ACTHU0_19855 [Kofleriaceae bacterium]